LQILCVFSLFLIKSDIFSGAGVLIDSNQDIYDGEFLNGQKSGIGKWFSAIGDQYIGDFKSDLFDGKVNKFSSFFFKFFENKNKKGQYTYTNGDIYSGDFLSGKKHGYGVLQQKNICTYQGEWENDIFNGQGILTKEDGISFQGFFTNGKLNNLEKSIIKYSNGDNYTGQVNNGVPEGQGVFKFSNGDINEGIFQEGFLKEKF